MTPSDENTLATFATLRARAREVARRARVPYSNEKAGAVLLLADGAWTPGVRIESASFSLTLPALLNAYTTARAAGRSDLRAAVLTRPFRLDERAFLSDALDAPVEPAAPDAYRIGPEPLPPVGDRLVPFLDEAPPGTPEGGLARTRKIARRAHVPHSHFPVGCLLVTDRGRLVPGVNIEHPDWTRTLCAERNALGTAVTYEADAVRVLYLSCLHDPAGSPCGACRQLIAELAPAATLWMDRGADPPERTTPEALLPGSFRKGGMGERVRG